MSQFAAIYADPPWQFRVWSKPMKPIVGGHGGRSAEDYYNTMSTDELCRLPVSGLALPDCCLFLWVCWPTLPDALRLGTAWGFEYKTCAFVWVKQTGRGNGWHTGMGYWTRANTEACLLFTRGNPKRQSKRVHQLIVEAGQLSLFPPIVAPVGRHSAKPQEVYSRIESLVDGPYCELFARVQWPGWTALGNEIDGLDIQEAIQKYDVS